MYISAQYRYALRLVLILKHQISSFFRLRRRFTRKKGFLFSHAKVVGYQGGFLVNIFLYNAETVVMQKGLFFLQFRNSIRSLLRNTFPILGLRSLVGLQIPSNIEKKNFMRDMFLGQLVTNVHFARRRFYQRYRRLRRVNNSLMRIK